MRQDIKVTRTQRLGSLSTDDRKIYGPSSDAKALPRINLYEQRRLLFPPSAKESSLFVNFCILAVIDARSPRCYFASPLSLPHVRPLFASIVVGEAAALCIHPEDGQNENS